MKKEEMSPLALVPIVVLAGLLCVACGEADQVNRAAITSSEAVQVAANTKPGAEPSKATQTAPGSGPKMAPTPGTIARETELKEKPFVDAKTIQKLSVQSSVTIVDRQGGWLRVTSGGKQGWVRMLHVSSQAAPAKGGDAKSIVGLATGRAGSGNIAQTSGIRGLTEEQLRTANPNPEELKKMEGYSATKEQAVDYARRHKLSPRQVATLPGAK